MRALVERNAAAGKGKRSWHSAVVDLADSWWLHHMQRCSICSLPPCWSLSRGNSALNSCLDHVLSAGRPHLWSRSGAHVDMTPMPCGCHGVRGNSAGIHRFALLPQVDGTDPQPIHCVGKYMTQMGDRVWWGILCLAGRFSVFQQADFRWFTLLLCTVAQRPGNPYLVTVMPLLVNMAASPSWTETDVVGSKQQWWCGWHEMLEASQSYVAPASADLSRKPQNWWGSIWIVLNRWRKETLDSGMQPSTREEWEVQTCHHPGELTSDRETRP